MAMTDAATARVCSETCAELDGRANMGGAQRLAEMELGSAARAAATAVWLADRGRQRRRVAAPAAASTVPVLVPEPTALSVRKRERATAPAPIRPSLAYPPATSSSSSSTRFQPGSGAPRPAAAVGGGFGAANNGPAAPRSGRNTGKWPGHEPAEAAGAQGTPQLYFRELAMEKRGVAHPAVDVRVRRKQLARATAAPA